MATALPGRAPSFAAQVWRVFKKDWQIELRTGEVLATTLFFSVLVTLTTSLAFSFGVVQETRVVPGALWIPVCFSSILGIARIWVRDREEYFACPCNPRENGGQEERKKYDRQHEFARARPHGHDTEKCPRARSPKGSSGKQDPHGKQHRCDVHVKKKRHEWKYNRIDGKEKYCRRARFSHK